MPRGPDGGLGELELPANEPGSSIMPGKVNPSQCEAMTMVALQVFGHDTTVAFANAQGPLQLNVYKPLILHDVLQSARLLDDACDAFTRYCVEGWSPTRPHRAHLRASLMLVTALVPHIGYSRAAGDRHRRAPRAGFRCARRRWPRATSRPATSTSGSARRDGPAARRAGGSGRDRLTRGRRVAAA